MGIIIGIFVTAAALWVTTAIVPGIQIESSVTSFLIVAVIFGLVNVFVRPFVKLLSLPVTILTLGLFSFVVNAMMLMLTALSPSTLRMHLVARAHKGMSLVHGVARVAIRAAAWWPALPDLVAVPRATLLHHSSVMT